MSLVKYKEQVYIGSLTFYTYYANRALQESFIE
jgi:hypothetical protein